MKRIPFFLAASALVFFLACTAKVETKMDPIPAADMNVVAASFTVKDFDMWKKGYMSHDSMRTAYAMETLLLGQGVDNPNMVYLVNKTTDLQKSKSLFAMPEMKTMMDSSGMIGAPTIEYAHVIRLDTSMAANKMRLRVSHHVKDFDAWLKVYDAEGRAERAKYGLADRAMARGLEDRNMVYITFYVVDKDKAMARGSSPELKKLMMDAGVDSEPKMVLYNVVN
ncbi:MAG: hypothetical protein ABIQ02_15655 [Saprospiraceae bacterium]